MIWDIEPFITIFGFSISLYGLMFATGLTFGAMYLISNARKLDYKEKHIEWLIVICFIGIFLGARLVHCYFYDFAIYKYKPIEVFLPIAEQEDGTWTFVPYHGLASHGGALGLIAGLGVFYLITRRNLFAIMDVLAIATCVVAGFIRIGNFMNSEIVGLPSQLPWSIVFENYDSIPRHPAQLYESLFYFLLFGVMAILYVKKIFTRVKDGFYLGLICIVIASFRVLIEYVKEVQVDFENAMLFNVGQLLSVPFFLAGVIILCYTQKIKLR